MIAINIQFTFFTFNNWKEKQLKKSKENENSLGYDVVLQIIKITDYLFLSVSCNLLLYSIEIINLI